MALFFLPKSAPMSGGNAYPACKLYFYATGTSTAVDVYSDSGLTTAHAWPVVADSGGVFAPIYVDAGTSYRVVLKSSGDVTLYDVDPFPAAFDDAAAIGEILYPQSAAELAASATPTDYAYGYGDPRRFGAVCDGSTTDTSALNTALSVGGRVFIPAGLTLKASAVTMGVARTELDIQGTLYNPTAAAKAITVSGADCKIGGSGRILSVATFDGTNSQRTYGVIWVTGTGAHIDGITLENVPRAGIHFEGATGGRVSSVRIRGNFPYASYTGTNTGHLGIDYDMPTSTYADKVALVVTGCLIETCVQGVGSGNFGDAALEAGVAITGNTFNQCWDHGIYCTLGEGNVVTGNSFVSCKIPIVVDGVGAVVSGNSLYSTEPTQTNGTQVISVRDARGATITGNTIYGLGAGIFVDCVTTETVRDNVICGNTIISTGTATTTSAIRLGNEAQVSENNLIANNVISGDFFGEFVGAIQLEMESGYDGRFNVVRGNTIHVSNKAYGINVLRQVDAVIADNLIEFSDTVAGTATYTMLNVDTSDTCLLARNNFVWGDAGGANLTVRCINLESGCTSNRLEGNRYRITATVTAITEVSDSGTTTAKIATGGTPAANTATPTGATAFQLPVHDAEGTVIGYAPVYAAAWT